MTRRLLPLLLLAACGDNGNANVQPDAPVTPPPDAKPGDPLPPGAGIAVVNSDFRNATSISLLDASGTVVKADCINSGSKPPGSTTALSGDVSLPTWPAPGNPVVIVDRRNGALTWLDAACAVKAQLDVSTGFFANPHDVVAVSATKAYVTRYERNATPTAAPGDFDEGDDVLIIDPSVPAVKGRIDLSAYAVTATGAAIQARPERARLVDGKLYVVLNNINDTFDVLTHGRVVIIDTATDKVTGMVDLPDLVNCAHIAYIEAKQQLVVTCAGDYMATDTSLTSGIAYIDVKTGKEAGHVLAAAFGGRPIGAYSGLANDGTVGYVVTPGNSPAPPTDQLWQLDVATGKGMKIVDSDKSFTFGGVLIDPVHQWMYLTDANPAMPRVHVYEGGARKTSINVDTAHSLPPRELAWY